MGTAHMAAWLGWVAGCLTLAQTAVPETSSKSADLQPNPAGSAHGRHKLGKESMNKEEEGYLFTDLCTSPALLLRNMSFLLLLNIYKNSRIISCANVLGVSCPPS